MNKILFTILVLAFSLPAFAGSYLDKQLKEAQKNVKYNTVKTQTAIYQVLPVNTYFEGELKDPKLIKLTDVDIVDEKDYLAKLKSDNEIYNSKIKPVIDKKIDLVDSDAPVSLDFYNVYRIAEKLIRANNLQYANWRIAIRKTPEEINAYASSANLITLHTSIYDSFYSNNDALALIIGHEMGHLILGHSQRIAEYNKELVRINEMSSVCIHKSSLCGLTSSTSRLIKTKKLYAELRQMEFMADNYGAMLAYRAGFDLNNGMAVYNLLNSLEHVKTFQDTHPQPEKRIENILETGSVLPVEWINEGKYNILHSNVLNVKKSSDRVSIVISQDPSAEKAMQAEDALQIIKRFAYVNYRNRKMEDAIKYFKKWAEITADYIPYLYMSYANEYLYRASKEPKYLSNAKKDIEKAKSINSVDSNIQKQIADLNAL